MAATDARTSGDRAPFATMEVMPLLGMVQVKERQGGFGLEKELSCFGDTSTDSDERAVNDQGSREMTTMKMLSLLMKRKTFPCHASACGSSALSGPLLLFSPALGHFFCVACTSDTTGTATASAMRIEKPLLSSDESRIGLGKNTMPETRARRA